MMNNIQFLELERRLWREGNPLTDELTSTRDELVYLLTQAKQVMEKYSPILNECSMKDDLEFYREWDAFCDSLDNLTYHLGE